MKLLDRGASVLVLIDMQGRLMEQIHRPSLVIEANRRLLQLAEMFEVPVILTEQYPQGLGETHPDLLEAFEALRGPKVRLEKNSFGCCGDDGFVAALDAFGASPGRQVVVGGVEAHICVLQTVLELLAQGDDVHLCWDAVSGRGDEYRRESLARMHAAGAVSTNHESVGFEWARTSRHPAFREMSGLFKSGQPS
jgi:nicotinamidase-related amidase